MPTYIFENKDTGEVYEKFMGIQEADEFLEENPHIKRLPTAPSIIGGHGDRTKTDSGMKEVFSKISDANPHSALAETYGKKDALSVKKRNIVKKARKKFGSITGNT